jgi:hypothetical protein
VPRSIRKRDLRVLNISLDKSDSDTVIPHPPPAPWDDQAIIDLPYDNPFYTRTIDNVLWLPQNPWYMAPSLIPTLSPPEQISISPVMKCSLGLPDVDGTESIDLPPVIAQPVQAKDVGVEQVLRAESLPYIHGGRVLVKNIAAILRLSDLNAHKLLRSPYYLPTGLSRVLRASV